MGCRSEPQSGSEAVLRTAFSSDQVRSSPFRESSGPIHSIHGRKCPDQWRRNGGFRADPNRGEARFPTHQSRDPVDPHTRDRAILTRLPGGSLDTLAKDQAMGSDDLKSPIFFVCGTPSDRYGFECITLDGRQFPDRPARYLDNVPAEKFPKRGDATHFFYRDGPEGWAMYAEYRSIHPNDVDHNRGAFIAVGCWSNAALTPDRAMEALFRIEAVHRDLVERRHPDTDSFPPDFQLRAYAAPNPATVLDPVEVDRLRLADLFCQAAAGRGTYGGQSGALILTSNEVDQGSLARLCTPSPEARRASAEPAPPDPGSWQTRLYEVMRDAAHEAPQTRQALQRLSKLEDERAEVIKSLTRVANEALRRSRLGKAAPARSSRRASVAGMRRGVSTGPHLTTREIVFFALGATIGTAVVSAAILGVRFLG